MKFRFVVKVDQQDPAESWMNHYEHDLFSWDSAVAEAQGQVELLNKHEQDKKHVQKPWVYTLVAITTEEL